MLFEFVRQGIRNHTTVGAVLPSSQGLAKVMVAATLNRSKETGLRILEVGAGTGPVTGELLKRLHPGDQFECVELNHDFCELLRNHFPALSVHELSILDFDPPHRFDRIVSGLPLANFPAPMVEEIYRKFFQLLKPDGNFVMFHYLGLRHALRYLGRSHRRHSMAQILAMEKRLQPLVVEEHDILFNVPPARVTVRRRPEIVDHLLAGPSSC